MDGDLLSARQAAQELGYSERTARYQAAKAAAAGDPDLQKVGRSWVAPRWWWRQRLETPDPTARRPRRKRNNSSAGGSSNDGAH